MEKQSTVDYIMKFSDYHNYKEGELLKMTDEELEKISDRMSDIEENVSTFFNFYNY